MNRRPTIAAGSCGSCAGGDCDDCDGSCSCKSSGEYRDDCYDQSKIKHPTDGFRAGDYVRSTSSGEHGQVERVTYSQVYFRLHDNEDHVVGFEVRFVEPACMSCGGTLGRCACSPTK